MPRVTSGKAKNLQLEVPEIEDIRVVQDIVKLAVFSIIGADIENSTCLDLFAGSGSMGIEALSRGAKWCDFVDESYDAKEAITNNLQKAGFVENFAIFTKNAVKYLKKCESKYDYIFADPFYKDTAHKFLIKQLENLLESGGQVMFLHGENLNMDELITDTSFFKFTERKFGASIVTILMQR